MSGATRKILILSAKVLLAALLLTLVLRKVEWPQFWTSLRDIDMWLFGGAVVGFVASVMAISYRWWRLVRVQQIPLSLWEAVRLTFLGTFFNQIVLGTTGGDLVKAYYLSRHDVPKTTCLITVLVDRLMGLLGMTILSAVMLAILLIREIVNGGGAIERLETAAVIVGALLLTLSAAALLVYSRRLRRWLRLEKIYDRLPLAQSVGHIRQAVRGYRRNSGTLVRAMGQTIIAQLIFIGSISLIGASLSLDVPWYQYMIYIPVIYIVAAVPIVPGGVGLVEGMYITFLSPWAGESQIMALALLARLIPMFWALPGAVVAVSGAKIPSADLIQAEMGLVDEQPADSIRK